MKPNVNPFALPFPLAWFHPRSRAPWSARLGAVAEWQLSRIPQRKLESKPQTDLLYITMTSRAHWLLLRESLVSLHRAWKALPKLVIISDGSWKPEEFHAAFSFWPNPIQLLMPGEVLEPFIKKGQLQLIKLSEAQPYGIKLAAIILLAQTSEVLCVDSDILWFKDPAEILQQARERGGPASVIESGRSYNEDMIRRFCPEGLPAPSINSGMVYLKGDLFAPEMLQAVLDSALEQPKHGFMEQTVITIAVVKNGRRFPAELCLVDYADALTLKRRKSWQESFHSRHYVNLMRHQFYRDALTLRRLAI